MKWRAWGRLVRLSLAPSAAADALAGATLGAWGLLPLSAAVPVLVLGSLCVFHGGMALNDWVDREGDRRTRPERPLPSGAIGARQALAVAVTLLVLGPLAVLLVAPAAGLCLAAASLAAALYDLAGRGPWTGPTLLALCRALNLGAGVLAGAFLVRPDLPGVPRWGLAACLLYGAYVFSASRLARLEDDEDRRPLGQRPSRELGSAAACLVLLPWIPLLLAQAPAPPLGTQGSAASGVGQLVGVGLPVLGGLLLAGSAAWGLFCLARDRREWTRAQVGAATGMALRRLLIFTSVCALLAWIPRAQARYVDAPAGVPAVLVAALLLAGYPLALRLRRLFPPT